ncbi:MAG: B12-binding domain-containing radical SAM protein [Calditrichia bacterium]
MNKINAWFINPWVTDFTAYDLWSKPLGLLYIISFLREYAPVNPILIDVMDRFHPYMDKYGYHPKKKKYGIGNYHREIIEKPDILKDVPRYFSYYGMPQHLVEKLIGEYGKNYPPDIVFVTSIMTYWYPGVQSMISLIKTHFKDVPIVLGGIYPTLLPNHARVHSGADYIIEGPGEIAALELLEKLFPEYGISIPESKNMDQFPWPAMDLYPHLPYLVVMTSRGCPFRCSFCASHLLQKSFMVRSYPEVVEEIIVQSKKFQIRDVAFYDDALLVNRDKHFKPILEELLKRTSTLRYHTPNGLHGKYIDQEVAELMVKNNFKTIRISFEYYNPDKKDQISNKISNDEFIRAVSVLEKAGYKRKMIESYIIMGLPGQSVQEVLESMLFLHSQGVLIRLASFSPIPGTDDFEKAVEEGMIPPDIDPLLCNKSIFPLYKNFLSYQVLQKLRQFTIILNEATKRGVNFISDHHLASDFFNAFIKLKN